MSTNNSENAQNPVGVSGIPATKAILYSLSLVMRYVASGFIGLMVYTFLFWSDVCKSKNLDFLSNPWFLIILAASLGLITYSVHKAFLDSYFHAMHLKTLLTKKRFHVTEPFKKRMLEGYRAFNATKKIQYEDLIKSKMKIRFSVKSQGFLIGMSDDPKIVRLKQQLRERYDMLTFTYCTLYQSTATLLFFLLSKLILHETFPKAEVLKVVILFLIIVFLFFSIFKYDRRLCKREIWVISEFGLNLPEKTNDQNQENEEFTQ